MTELSGAMPGLASEGGAMSVTGNLFAGLPGKAAAEAVETLVRSPAVRIERIVSTGQASPPGFWYDEPLDEWVVVLAGSAGLLVAGEDGPRTLRTGDHVHLPAHCRHRVEWTDGAPDGLARRAFRGVSARLRAEAPGCASAQREATSWFLSPALPRTSRVAAEAGDELASQTVG
jgi:cupin 2 domain-containing protein